MLPIFQYEDFVRKVKQKKKEKGVIVFGILICDYRQQSCREYILNYLNQQQQSFEDILYLNSKNQSANLNNYDF